MTTIFALFQYTFNTFIKPKMKIVEFANSTDMDEMTYNELTHLDLSSLLSSP